MNQDLLDNREDGDWALDYQAGIYAYKSWGPGVVFHETAAAAADAAVKSGATNAAAGAFWRGDWFLDGGADFSYYHRYRSWIGYGQFHEGLRLAQWGSKVAFDGYLVENLTWDVHGNYYDNFVDLGPGARAIWLPHPNWQVVLRTEWLWGFYFGRDELDSRGDASGTFDGVHVSLSVGARW
jgi:hypothetical protein